MAVKNPKPLLLIVFLASTLSCFAQKAGDTIDFVSYLTDSLTDCWVYQANENGEPSMYKLVHSYPYDSSGCRYDFDPNFFHRLWIRKIERYFNALKHGKEVGFYACLELRKPYQYPEEFGIEYKGKWKKGLRVGKWKYYDQQGALTSIRIYRKGKLRREVVK